MWLFLKRRFTMKLEDKRLKKVGVAYSGTHDLLEKVPGVNQSSRISLVNLFEKVPSFLCYRLPIDEKDSDTSSGKMMRAIRLPEGTQYRDSERNIKTAGVGGVFIVENQWVDIHDINCRPFHRAPLTAERHVEFSVYEADKFEKLFALERKEDASQKAIENVIRFMNAEQIKPEQAKKTLARIQEFIILRFILGRSKLHQKGRIDVPVNWQYY